MSAGLEVDGGYCRIILDRPKANVLDAAMIASIRGHLRSLATVSEARLLVFSGQGTEFSFGASVEEHQRGQVAQMLASFHAMFREIEALGIPTAAAVRGRCLGGGLELAAWCSRVVAAPGALLGCPEVKLGVFPPIGALVLPWRMGPGPALDMVCTGATLSAEQALAAGLVDAVAPDPEAALRETYERAYAPLSAVALRFAHRAGRLVLADRLAQDLPRLEAMYLDELMDSHDANEGIAAFIGKRPPTWSHA